MAFAINCSNYLSFTDTPTLSVLSFIALVRWFPVRLMSMPRSPLSARRAFLGGSLSEFHCLEFSPVLFWEILCRRYRRGWSLQRFKRPSTPFVQSAQRIDWHPYMSVFDQLMHNAMLECSSIYIPKCCWNSDRMRSLRTLWILQYCKFSVQSKLVTNCWKVTFCIPRHRGNSLCQLPQDVIKQKCLSF